eukprot:Gb_14541 [translate_table: standard]
MTVEPLEAPEYAELIQNSSKWMVNLFEGELESYGATEYHIEGVWTHVYGDEGDTLWSPRFWLVVVVIPHTVLSSSWPTVVHLIPNNYPQCGGVEFGLTRGRLKPLSGHGGRIIGPPGGGGGMLDMGPLGGFEGGVDWGCKPPYGGGTL